MLGKPYIRTLVHTSNSILPPAIPAEMPDMIEAGNSNQPFCQQNVIELPPLMPIWPKNTYTQALPECLTQKIEKYNKMTDVLSPRALD